MADRRELGFPNTSACCLKEQLARTTLQTVRLQGHAYVELREDGKRFIFFCTLCLAPCYSDSVLLDHLNGNLHKERFSCAKVTLFGPNPWPFNDGVLFFDNSTGNEKSTSISDSEHIENNDHAIVTYSENMETERSGHDECKDHVDLLIRGVLIKERTVDLKARFVGLGQIAARLCEKEGNLSRVGRIWCEWLGKEGPLGEEKSKVPVHDFAVVTFSYYYNLGRLGLIEETKYLLTCGPSTESENGEENGRKRKKSFSDPEDTSESFSNQYDSSEEVSSASNPTSSKALLAQHDDQLLHRRVVSNKAIRRELRQQQRIFSERLCEICKQKMLPGKDMAAIMNLKTGKLACFSRNLNGAFHLFHTSCLVHWFLLCEHEIITNQTASTKGKKRPRKKGEAKKNGENNGVSSQIFSVFCPECQGTGINLEGDELERDTFPLSQMFRYFIKVSDARKAWIKSPEKLQNCSTGFHFPAQTEESVHDKVSTLKLLRFYRVEE